MLDARLIHYIKESRALKIPDKEIARTLAENGWDVALIKQAMETQDVREVIIHVQDLTKEYRPSKKLIVPAIQGIASMSIYRGEFVAITGQSGSGKSTLLNLIGLMDLPTSGEVWIGKQNSATLSNRQRNHLRLRTISFIFQFYNLLENYSALENIMFQMKLQGSGHSEAKTKAKEILQFLDMEEKADFLPSELSGGQQQRIAIGRALAKDSEIILADEPTSHLDTQNSEKIIGLLREINYKFGKTIVLVTHETQYAELTDRVIRIIDGKLARNEHESAHPVDWDNIMGKPKLRL